MLILMAVCVSCKKEPDPELPFMTFSIDLSWSVWVEFQLAGSEKAIIDWGDGSESKTHTLLSYHASDWDSGSPKYRFRHVYFSSDERPDSPYYTIKITGENITHLDCSHVELMSLDVSKNAKLIYLRCGSNGLSIKMLNDLFKTLHSNNSDYKSINISNNPGTDACDRSIATDKGWSVYSYSYTYIYLNQ